MSRQHRKSYKQIQSMLSLQCQASLMTTTGFILKGWERWDGRCFLWTEMRRLGDSCPLRGRQTVGLLISGCHTKACYFSCSGAWCLAASQSALVAGGQVRCFPPPAGDITSHQTSCQQAHLGIGASFLKISFQFPLFKDKVNRISLVPLSFV